MIEKNNHSSSARILEEGVKLSDSLIWHLQNVSYAEAGPEAWTKGVPFYITSNPYIARAYAQVFLGFLRDCLSMKSDSFSDLS